MLNENSKYAPMIHALESGDLTPSQLSAVSKALHVGMLNSALLSIKESDAVLSKLKPIEDMAMGFLEESISDFLSSADVPTIMKFLGEIGKLRKEAVSAKIKVYGTRDMFNINPVSEDDRALLSLLKLVDTPEKRDMLKDFISSSYSDTIEIESTDEDNVIDNMIGK